jgi:hypothetical protein
MVVPVGHGERVCHSVTLNGNGVSKPTMNAYWYVPIMTDVRFMGVKPCSTSNAFWSYIAEAKSGIYRPYMVLHL